MADPAVLLEELIHLYQIVRFAVGEELGQWWRVACMAWVEWWRGCEKEVQGL